MHNPCMTNRKLVMAGVAWGDHHTDMLINYCLPSMLPSIMSAIVRRDVILVIHTDNPQKIAESPAANALRNLGIDSRYFPVGDDTQTEDKYAMLGKYQALGLDYALERHADFHSLMPDHVYCSQYFGSMMAMVIAGRKAITRLCLSTSLEGMAMDLAQYRDRLELSIPSSRLATLALKNLHPRSQGWRVAGSVYPDMHVAFFEYGNRLAILSPHQSVCYVDRDQLQKSETARPLDNELQNIIKRDCPIYSPRADDYMAWVEIARSGAGVLCTATSSAEQFIKCYWEVLGEKDGRYLEMVTEDFTYNCDRTELNGFLGAMEDSI